MRTWAKACTFHRWVAIPALLSVMVVTDREAVTAHTTGGYSHDSSPGYTNTDWMASVPGCLLLSEISMPGTHDTMSDHGTDYVQTQSMKLDTQLESGIRVLDIRVRHIADSFAIHHGSVFLDAFFGADVMEPTIAFLDAHPGETVLMRVKDEYDAADNTRTFQETFDWYMSLYGSHVWQPTGNIPTLSEVRGKIVILQNFSSTPANKYGLSYGDLDDQDEYVLSSNWDLHSKWEKVKAHLVKARDGSRATMYINYLSGSFEFGGGPVFPYFVASGHSSPGTGAPRLSTGLTTPGWKDSYPDFPRVDCLGELCTIAFEGTNVLTSDYIRNGNTSFSGIVMADFPGGGLIQQIIGLNPTNHVPVANAGGPYTANEGSAIAFDASGSSDADGDALQYRWDFDDNGTWDTAWSNSPQAAHTWHDDWSGLAKVAVSDGCEATVATAQVTVNNVAPTVTMTQIADGEPFILTNLVVNFVAAFGDPGQDTHTATVAWQGGNPPTSVRNPATSPVSDSRFYATPGTYSVMVTVQDDDGGIGQASTSVRILSPQQATETGIEELRQLAANRDIADALANLDGNNGGKARNGALDAIAKGNTNAAYGKLQKALESLIAAEQATSGLDLTKHKALLVNVGRSIAVEMIAKADASRRAPAKVEQARALLAQGAALQAAGDAPGALSRYQDAARRVQGAAD